MIVIIAMAVIAWTFEARLFNARGHKKVMNALHRRAMERVRDLYWPLHFTTQAYSRYGFEKRSARWQKKKAAVKGHQKPLVYSGALMDAVLNRSRIGATANRGTLTARAPFPLTEERRDEIEIVTSEERRQLRDWGRKFYRQAAVDPQFKDFIRQRQRKG